MAGQMVSFPSNGGTAEGYLATPASGKGPGVIVIQEWWGLNDNIKGIADRFAAEGYLALAPDLYHGKVTAEPDEAGKIDDGTEDGRGGEGHVGAVRLPEEHAACTGKVGSVGFCLGGGLSLYRLDAEARRRDRDLLRRAAGRAARPHEAAGPGARALRRERRLGEPGRRGRAREAAQDRRQAGRSSTCTRARSTASSTTRARRSTSRGVEADVGAHAGVLQDSIWHERSPSSGGAAMVRRSAPTRSRLDLDVVHRYLSPVVVLGAGIRVEVVERGVENSLNFGVYNARRRRSVARA